jgi:glycosyltransferase involved in cell wall biosynthesis
VIIDELVLQEHPAFFKFAKNFDTIICNTIITWPVVNQMQQTVKTIWWLQEAKLIPPLMDSSYDFTRTLRHAQHLISVSEYSISFIKDYNPRYTKIYNACTDFCGALDETATNNAPKDTLIFSIVGSIEHRKGQDVLINAMNYLDDEVLQKIEIHIVGRTLDEQFRQKLNSNIRHSDRVRFLGEMSHEDSISYLYGSDVIISASRDDPFPVVLVEAFCMGKPCIVSDRTGNAELITDRKNGFVFASENARELARKITYITRNAGMVPRIGAEARITYEKFLTLGIFEKKLLNYLNNMQESVPRTAKPETRLSTILSEG